MSRAKQRADRERPEKMWAELARYYDVMYKWKDYQAEAHRVRDLVKQHGGSTGRTLLDVACGTRAHDGFLHRDFDVTGVDLSAEMLRVARKKLPDHRLLE